MRAVTVPTWMYASTLELSAEADPSTKLQGGKATRTFICTCGSPSFSIFLFFPMCWHSPNTNLADLQLVLQGWESLELAVRRVKMDHREQEETRRLKDPEAISISISIYI